MPHKLLGTVVTYMRPQDVKGKRILVPIEATVIGVEPVEGASPNLHLAFLHPDRLDSLTGSGWRDAFDRAISVRPQSDPLVPANPGLAYYKETLPPAKPVVSVPAQTPATPPPAKPAASVPAQPAAPATPAASTEPAPTK